MSVISAARVMQGVKVIRATNDERSTSTRYIPTAPSPSDWENHHGDG
ncbi:hypothetical protein KCP75_04425 [Salmonella enterica subsp. enterica]|nr:hypothetical protein KCP75_04425 [Salmonella enterica subsp. enterica]